MVSAPTEPDKKYFGIVETAFKDRFRNHKGDFHKKKSVDSADLNRHIRKLKDEKITPSIKWN